MPDLMNPRYRPKTLDQKLGYLVEECGEVLAAVGKTIRWGHASSNPEIPEAEREANADWVLREIHDLERAIDMVKTHLARLGYAQVHRGHVVLTHAEASILGALLRQGAESQAFSATSVANRAQRLGLSKSELDLFQEKLEYMDGSAGAAGLT